MSKSCRVCDGPVEPADQYCAYCGFAVDGQELGDSAPGNSVVAATEAANIILTSVITASIIPFVQAIATSAGQDAYAKLKGYFDKRQRPEEGKVTEAVCVTDSVRGLSLHIDVPHISQHEAQQLFRLDLADPRLHHGRVWFYRDWRFQGADGVVLIWNDRRRKWKPERDRQGRA